MIRALYTAASGMSAQQLNLDTIANNLANSATTGFRQLRLQFQDMVYQNLVTPGAAQSQSTVSAGLQIGLGTKSAASEIIMSATVTTRDFEVRFMISTRTTLMLPTTICFGQLR